MATNMKMSGVLMLAAYRGLEQVPSVPLQSHTFTMRELFRNNSLESDKRNHRLYSPTARGLSELNNTLPDKQEKRERLITVLEQNNIMLAELVLLLESLVIVQLLLNSSWSSVVKGGPFSGSSASVMVRRTGFGSVEHTWTLCCSKTGGLSLTSNSLIINVPVPVAGSSSTVKKPNY